MERFDEKLLVRELQELDPEARVIFATAAASRQLENIKNLGRVSMPEAYEVAQPALVMLWKQIATQAPIDRDLWTIQLDAVMSRIPEEGESYSVLHAFGDDALSSLAYSISGLLSGSAQDLAWSAQRAYVAADQAVIRILDIDLNGKDAEEKLVSHEIVQRELTRQRRDIRYLQSGDRMAPRQFASYEVLLKPVEVEAALRNDFSRR